MKYMVDNNVNGLAVKLRSEGIDCETSIKLIRGDEDSSLAIKDPKILKFLIKAKQTITLITADHDLIDYCEEFNVPVIPVEKPDNPSEFGALSTKLSGEIKKKSRK